jgi:uncharacterized protein YpmB
MKTNTLLRLTALFYSLASEEELPANSKDIKTILKNIEDLETYASRKAYAEKNLEHLSSGSSRIVYLTPKKTVIKLAKNDKGIAQNKEEVAADKCSSKYINKVLDQAKNHSWIEVPFLDDLTEKEFEDMTDITFKDFADAIEYGLKAISGNSDKKKPKNFDDVEKTDIYRDIVDVAKKKDLMPGDLGRISSWRAKDGKPILADAGLSEKIFSEFYEDKNTTSGTTSKS